MRLAIMGAVVLGLVAFFIYLTTRLASPQMSLLFGDLDPSEASRIMTHLQSQNVPYDTKKNGTELHVPSDRVATLRISLAEQGIPAGGTIGYEILTGLGSRYHRVYLDSAD